jgi:hypothetical protein
MPLGGSSVIRARDSGFCVTHTCCAAVAVIAQPPHSPDLAPAVQKQKQTPWSESASELYRPSDRRLSAK